MMWDEVKVRKLYQFTLSFKVNHSAISYTQKLISTCTADGVINGTTIVFCDKISSKLTVKLSKG